MRKMFEKGNIYLKYNDGTSSCFNHSNYISIADLPVSNYESFLSTFFPLPDGCLCSIDYNDDGLMDFIYGGAVVVQYTIFVCVF